MPSTGNHRFPTNVKASCLDATLLRAPFEPLGQHGNCINGHRRVPYAGRSRDLLTVRAERAEAGDVQRLLAGTGERGANGVTGCWNEAEVLSFGAEHLNAGVGADVKAACRIDRHAVAVSTGFELAEFTLIFNRTIRLYIEGRDHRAVGDVQCLLIRAEHDAVGAQILADAAHLPARAQVERSAAGEISSAFLIGHEVVDAPESLAREVIGQDLAHGRQGANCRRLGALVRLGAQVAAWIGTGPRLCKLDFVKV